MTKTFLWSLLAVKAFIMILIILYGGIGLGPDEAQYWTWSQHLDFGYYSKPPGIAWQIYLGTLLFGSTELGVRFGAVVLGTLLAWAVYRLGKAAQAPEEIAVLAGCITALSPIGIFSTFLAITDGGMLLFWTLALTELVKDPPKYLRMGFWMACGALFKWPIYWLWLLVLIAWFFWPKLRTKAIWGGILISLLGLLPSLYWNASHDWATFKHVLATMQGGHEGTYARGNPLEFIGAQVAIVSPLLFLLLSIAWIKLYRQKGSILFLGATSLGILLACITYTIFKKGQGNWCLFAYPGAFVYLAYVWQGYKKWIWAALAVSVILTGLLFAIPSMQKHSIFSSFRIPWKINPFHHNLGWNAFNKIPFDPETQFLIGDKYQTTSELSFYNPFQKQAYFFNFLGTRKNQFSYWQGPEKGQDGIFVVVENSPDLNKKLKMLKENYMKILPAYFNAVEEPTALPMFRAYGKTVKGALVFRCYDFKGNMPEDPEKY